MIRQTLKTAPALALALLALSQGAVVEAGFVSAESACIRGEVALLDLEGAGAGAAPEKNDSPLQPLVEDHVRDSAPAPSFSLFGTGGMSSPLPDHVSGNAPVAVLTADGIRQTQLAVWFAEDGRAGLPPPLSTGIFRPPRFVG